MSQPQRAAVALRQLGDRLAATTGLETVIDTALESIDDLLGHGSSLLLVYQAELDRLVTLASRGYDSGGVGSTVGPGADVGVAGTFSEGGGVVVPGCVPGDAAA